MAVAGGADVGAAAVAVSVVVVMVPQRVAVDAT